MLLYNIISVRLGIQSESDSSQQPCPFPDVYSTSTHPQYAIYGRGVDHSEGWRGGVDGSTTSPDVYSPSTHPLYAIHGRSADHSEGWRGGVDGSTPSPNCHTTRHHYATQGRGLCHLWGGSGRVNNVWGMVSLNMSRKKVWIYARYKVYTAISRQHKEDDQNHGRWRPRPSAGTAGCT